MVAGQDGSKAVDQLGAAVGQLVGQETTGEADYTVQRLQSRLLYVGMKAIVQFVCQKIAGAGVPHFKTHTRGKKCR